MKLYNTLTRSLQELKIPNNTVTLYVCGITPYDTTHLGHAFTYISFDVLLKYLTYKGNKVIYTQNVTDINDRDKDILERAKEQDISWQELSSFWTKKFLDDMGKLNWTKPTNYLYASEQLQPMINLIQKIIVSGAGYVVNGSVYLNVETFPKYGELSKLSKEQMLGKAKEYEEDVDNPDKKHPLDITLWRASTPNQPFHIPSFDSPWSKGRPGWHIECSAMAISSLEDTIDIHGGGIDLVYPHHEDEIAQSEKGTGKSPFAKIWMHTALVQKDGQKMAKSVGNLVMVSDLLKNYSPNAIRFMLLSHHYHESWDFKEEELLASEKLVVRLKEALTFKDTNLEQDKSALNIFETYMENDMYTPKVLEEIKGICEDILDKKVPNLRELANSLKIISRVLGFVF